MAQALIDDIYECGVGAADWNALLHKLRDAFQCRAVAYSVMDMANDSSYSKNAVGFDYEDLAEEYQRYWDAGNPWRRHVLDVVLSQPSHWYKKPTRFAASHDIREFWKTDTYRACLKKQDFSDHIIIPVSTSIVKPVGLSLFCGHDKLVFSDTDYALAHELTAHLQRSFKVAESVSSVRLRFAGNGLSPDAGAALLLSEELEIIEANAAAEEFISRERTVRRRYNGQLEFANRKLQDRLRAFIAKEKTEGVFGLADHMVCRLDIAPNLSADLYRISSVWNEVSLMPVVNEYLMIFNDRRSGYAKAIEKLCEEYELTHTEKRVFSLLCQGQNLVEISGRRKTKLSTTRWHVKQIYRKLDVSSQGELFKRIIKAMSETDGALPTDEVLTL